MGGVKTERVFPGLSVLRKNNKMEVLSPEKWKYYPRKKKIKKVKLGQRWSTRRLAFGDFFPGTVLPKCA
jgi:hypothetical protein